MTIPLATLIQLNVPTATFGLGGNVQISDHGDGKGAVIQVWNIPNIIKPDAAQLSAWQDSSIQAYTFQQNAITNATVLAQLTTLDLQSIRALREPGNASTTKLNTLTSQASTLRAQLLPTS